MQLCAQSILFYGLAWLVNSQQVQHLLRSLPFISLTITAFVTRSGSKAQHDMSCFLHALQSVLDYGKAEWRDASIQIPLLLRASRPSKAVKEV